MIPVHLFICVLAYLCMSELVSMCFQRICKIQIFLFKKKFFAKSHFGGGDGKKRMGATIHIS